MPVNQVCLCGAPSKNGVCSVVECVANSNKPEGILRSTWLPKDTCNGAQLFLSYENRWYVVHTSHYNLSRYRTFEKAAKLYDRVVMGKSRKLAELS